MFHKQAYYNPYIQIGAMKNRYPQFTFKRKSNEAIEFVGDLVVKPSFPTYTVSITYNGGLRPIVKIVNPKLVEDPPHFFKKFGFRLISGMVHQQAMISIYLTKLC